MISSEKPNILFLEDEKLFQKIVCKVFPKYNFILTSSVKEATKVLEEHHEKIRLIISDNMLEVKKDEGVEFLKYCEKRYPSIRRILVTGFTTKKLEQEQSFIIMGKPVAYENFINTIKQLVENEIY